MFGVLVLASLGAVGAARGQTNGAAAARPVSLDDCIASALEKNFEIRMERSNTRIAQYGLAGAYGVYEPVFEVGVTRKFVDQPATFDPKKADIDLPYELTRDQANASINGFLPTGLTYQLGGTANFLDAQTDFRLIPTKADPFPGGIRVTNQYYSTAGISLKQPLLKDFWIDSQRQVIAVSKQNLKISESALRWKIMNTVTTVETTYFEWVYAQEAVRAQERALELSKSLLKSTRLAIGNGLLPALDEKQVESEVESATAKLYAAQQTLSSHRAALRNLITDRYHDEADQVMEPATGFSKVPTLVNRNESWVKAMDQRPDLVQVRADLEKQRILIRYRKNQLFPNLDLVGSYGVQGWNSSFSGTLDDVKDQSHPNYAYGVVLSFPIGGNQSAKNQLRATKESREQALIGMEKLAQDILVQVDVAWMKVDSAQKQADSTRRARQYAEDAWRAAESKVEYGKITILDLIQVQERLTAQLTAEARALADYNQALAQLALSEGSVLKRHGLDVKVK